MTCIKSALKSIAMILLPFYRSPISFLGYFGGTCFTHSLSLFLSYSSFFTLTIRLTVATARATKRADKVIAKIGFILLRFVETCKNVEEVLIHFVAQLGAFIAEIFANESRFDLFDSVLFIFYGCRL